MKNFKIEKKRILLYVLLILGFIGIALFAFSDLSTIGNYKSRIAEEKEEDQQEDAGLTECKAEQLPDLFNRPDKIEVITSDGYSDKVILTASTIYNAETNEEAIGCYADLTEDITNALGDKATEPFEIRNAIYLGNGTIAYNYGMRIYIQKLTGEGSIKPILDKKITSTEAWETLNPSMYGPYLIYGERNGIIANPQAEEFLFTVDYVWGCEQDSDEEYCASMLKFTKQFCNVEKIPGIWEYDVKTGKATPIKTGDCNF